MTKEIKAYIAEIVPKIDKCGSAEECQMLKNQLLTRISFYQHERMVHLIVTMTFAVMTVLSFIAVIWSPVFCILALLFLALEVPYIVHYYFLENSVQALYKLYYRLENYG